MHREEGAEGVAIRVLVGGEQEPVAGTDLVCNTIEAASQNLCRFSHSSLRRREMRSPRSALSSYSKVKVGVRFIRIALAILP